MGLPIISEEFKVFNDPDLKFGQDGTPRLEMTLVTSSRKEDPPGSGQWKDKDSLWVRATAWRKVAENAAESIVKGDLVVVVGEIYTHQYIDQKDQSKRSLLAMNIKKIGPSMTFRSTPHGVTEQNRQANNERPPAGQNNQQTQTSGNDSLI